MLPVDCIRRSRSAFDLLAAAGALVLTSAACAPSEADPVEYDLAPGLVEGKADLHGAALADVHGDTVVLGRFVPNRAIFGYALTGVKPGAEITVEVTAESSQGEAIGTAMSLNEGFVSATDVGTLIDSSGDGTMSFDIETEETYLVAFTSFEDISTGSYEVRISCEGTDEQCGRQDDGRSCSPTMLLYQDRAIRSDTSWDACDVTLQGNRVQVAEDAALDIAPGATVTGSLGELRVDGALRAIGTEEEPIQFELSGTILLAGEEPHELRHVKIQYDGPQSAIHIDPGATGVIADATIEGPSNELLQNSGVFVGDDAQFEFHRALVSGFRFGLHTLRANEVLIEDSVIRDNFFGLRLRGSGSIISCGGGGGFSGVARDPVIRHTDVIENRSTGVLVEGRGVLLQIENSNIVGNGRLGIQLRATDLTEDSFIRESNIFGNEPSDLQLESFHFANQGNVDISDNFWGPLGDLQDLSRRFRAACSGFFTVNGFELTELEDAGPRLDSLIDPVKDHCFKKQQE